MRRFVISAKKRSTNLARRVAIGAESYELRTVGGAKIKADVIASHDPIVTHLFTVGNLPSGGEH